MGIFVTSVDVHGLRDNTARSWLMELLCFIGPVGPGAEFVRCSRLFDSVSRYLTAPFDSPKRLIYAIPFNKKWS